jgi:hypothetical protein
MGSVDYLDLINKDNIDPDTFLEVKNLYNNLSIDEKVDLINATKESDVKFSNPVCYYLLGIYFQSHLRQEMLPMFLIALSLGYKPALRNLAIIAMTKNQYENAESYLLAAINQGDKEAYILLGNMKRLIEKNYLSAIRYFALANAHDRLGDIYFYDLDRKDDALKIYINGVHENNKNCLDRIIDLYLLETSNNKDCYYKIAEFLAKKDKFHMDSLYFYNQYYNKYNPYELSLLYEKYKELNMEKEFFIYITNNMS